MSQSAWKPHAPSTYALLRVYQEPPCGDFIAYVDKLMAEQQARVRSPSASAHRANKQAEIGPTKSAAVKDSPSSKTTTIRKRGTSSDKPKPPIANLSKPHMVWLIISFVLTIIVPPVGSVLLLWAIAKILVLKLKTSNTNT